MEFIEVSGKTLEDAITNACQKLLITSDKLDYEIIEKGTTGFLGFNSKPAVIKAREKDEVEENKIKVEKPVIKEVKSEKKNEFKNDIKKDILEEVKSDIKMEEKADLSKSVNLDDTEKQKLISAAEEFLNQVFVAMKMEVSIQISFSDIDGNMDIQLSGSEMGVLIGKRGQTLDSLQYLVSLVVNKDTSNYIRVKVDTEDYRKRRKDTLENLAKNLSYKVKRTKRPVSLEPMNPYERRIIHSALQNDKYVTTHSEGEEPYRRVVITLKKY